MHCARVGVFYRKYSNRHEARSATRRLENYRVFGAWVTDLEAASLASRGLPIGP
jgi:hypothetical protein